MTIKGGTVPTMNATCTLGKIYLPATGTPVGRFDFIVDPDRGLHVEVGTPVTAETREGPVIGAVIDMRTVGTDQHPVGVEMGSNYDGPPIAQESEVVLATVQVFHTQAMRPVRSGTVRAATAEEMSMATGAEKMDWTVPAGVVALADGTFARICLDGAGLLGPEGAHCLVSGISGQAAKSSFAGTLLRSAVHHGKAQGHSVGALLLNVKGEDLIWLDRPPSQQMALKEVDLAIYEALGTPPTPFEDVTVYAPAMRGGSTARSPRPDALRVRWDLAQLWPYMRVLFSYLNDDEKAMSFMAEFREFLLNPPDPSQAVNTFMKLDAWFKDVLATAEEEQRPMAWRSHHVATVRRMARMLGSLPARGQGLFSRESARPEEDVPDRNWHHGQIVVVDLAQLSSDIKAVAMARTIERLLKSAEEGTLGVDHLVIVADELNEYAPAQGGESPLMRRQLEKVATQGRYAGLSLIGLAQSASKISPLLRDQCATSAIGVTREGELATGVYGKLSSGLQERIATLPRGQVALTHYSFRSPLVVRFPRPAWQTGKAKTTGASKPTNTSVLREQLSKGSVARLTEGLNDDQVGAVLASADDFGSALEQLKAVRVPDVKKMVVDAPSGFNPDDPFDLELD